MKRLRSALNKLFAQKLVVALIVGTASAFSTSLDDYTQSGTPLTAHILVSVLIGAVVAGATRALLAFSPLNVVPSDTEQSLFGAKRRTHTRTAAHLAEIDANTWAWPTTQRTLKTILETPGRGRLGRHVEHDPASVAYGIEATGRALTKVLWARGGRPFNQGQLGSCTGNATAGLLNTAPFRQARGGKLLTEKDAVAIYELATTLDAIAGQYPPTDTGSSGLGACKAAKKLGYISGYKHAFSIHAALEALMDGPVITGVNWYDGFDNPDANGLVEISGQVRGGHEFEVLGYDPATDLVTAENSWGRTWGVKGRFHFTSATWARLLAEQGDATVPVPVG